MNKFIVFATLVVIMGVLPSNLGCNPPRNGKSRYDALHGKDRRNGPIEAGLMDLIEQGFAICNTDSEPGLTWPEINNCQVNHNRDHFRKYLISPQILKVYPDDIELIVFRIALVNL